MSTARRRRCGGRWPPASCPRRADRDPFRFPGRSPPIFTSTVSPAEPHGDHLGRVDPSSLLLLIGASPLFGRWRLFVEVVVRALGRHCSPAALRVSWLITSCDPRYRYLYTHPMVNHVNQMNTHIRGSQEDKQISTGQPDGS